MFENVIKTAVLDNPYVYGIAGWFLDFPTS